MAQRLSTDQRRSDIVRLIRSGVTHVADLARTVEVSPSTVRRDLAHLEGAGELARTYGGAMPRTPFRESALSERLHEAVDAKKAIGSRAADLVVDGATIFVDAGSTCAQLVPHLVAKKELTVITRGLDIATLLAEESVEVILVGGRVSSKSFGVAGALTALAMERLRVDVAFLGCDEVHPVDGVGEPTLEEAATKEIAARRSERVAVLAHSAKLARQGTSSWGRLPSGWALVTDESDDAVLAPFRAAGVSVVRA